MRKCDFCPLSPNMPPASYIFTPPATPANPHPIPRAACERCYDLELNRAERALARAVRADSFEALTGRPSGES